jgi:hypothetical protein
LAVRKNPVAIILAANAVRELENLATAVSIL